MNNFSTDLISLFAAVKILFVYAKILYYVFWLNCTVVLVAYYLKMAQHVSSVNVSFCAESCCFMKQSEISLSVIN